MAKVLNSCEFKYTKISSNQDVRVDILCAFIEGHCCHNTKSPPTPPPHFFSTIQRFGSTLHIPRFSSLALPSNLTIAHKIPTFRTHALFYYNIPHRFHPVAYNKNMTRSHPPDFLLPSPPASPSPPSSSRRRTYSKSRVIPTLQRHETLLADIRMGGRMGTLQLSFEELEEREGAWASESDADSQRSMGSSNSG
ncbi:hypothetical protein BDD12DRAFT_159690 [Trichophaea hybrida]|nr:hypothetical protein BDD12DRAFT_159690 [Trichophaea hybrida]